MKKIVKFGSLSLIALMLAATPVCAQSYGGNNTNDNTNVHNPATNEGPRMNGQGMQGNATNPGSTTNTPAGSANRYGDSSSTSVDTDGSTTTMTHKKKQHASNTTSTSPTTNGTSQYQ